MKEANTNGYEKTFWKNRAVMYEGTNRKIQAYKRLNLRKNRIK